MHAGGVQERQALQLGVPSKTPAAGQADTLDTGWQ